MPPYPAVMEHVSFLDKLPPEIRLIIYRFLWAKSKAHGRLFRHTHVRPIQCSANNGTQRSIHWRGSRFLLGEGLPCDYSYNCFSRKLPRKAIDTAVLSVCKFIYDEAYHELIANSTLKIEIDDVEELQQFPNMLNNMRYLEIRDTKKSEGRQLFFPPTRPRWASDEEKDEAENNEQSRALRLRSMGSFLKQIPLLKGVTIGFEVLHVIVTDLDDLFSLGTVLQFDRLSATMAQAHNNFEMSGLGSLTCTGIGTWRVEQIESPVIQVKHFTVISQLERCKLTASAYPEFKGRESLADDCDFALHFPDHCSPPCKCGGDEAKFEKMCQTTYWNSRELASRFIWLRHRLAQCGFLGPEAQTKCGAEREHIEAGRDMTNLEKTWFIIANDWPRYFTEL